MDEKGWFDAAKFGEVEFIEDHRRWKGLRPDGDSQRLENEQHVEHKKSEDTKAQLESLVLATLAEHPDKVLNSKQFLTEHPEFSVDEFVSVVRSLHSAEYVVMTQHKRPQWVLTEEGQESVKHGTIEMQIYNACADAGKYHSELESMFGRQVVKAGLGQAMKQKWLKVLKEEVSSSEQQQAGGKGKAKKPRPKMLYQHKAPPSQVKDEVRDLLQRIAAGETLDAKTLKQLSRRKLVKTVDVIEYEVRRAAKFQRERVKETGDLTVAMLEDGSWEHQSFKKYNFVDPQQLSSGALHPLMKVRHAFRQIFLEMGFEEMPTNNYVESSFWNFDTLFQPQQHPARDAHDTFFVKDPAQSKPIPTEYGARVKRTHERGGYHSIGYRYDWSEDEARKNILRTHTTAVSSRMLCKLAQQKPFRPARYFSIDRVFRNEDIDAKHLAEFFQVEGFVADYDLTLGHLIGTLNSFYEKIGITELKFKPAYNPYTEPSMEVFGRGPDGQLIEIGNSGIFRPEMLRPMGLPENVRVIAWGLGLERATMMKFGYKDIRDLFGYKMNIVKIASNPNARFD